jgi:hypothetical protein
MMKHPKLWAFAAGLACGAAAAACLPALLQGGAQVKVLLALGIGSVLFIGYQMGALLNAKY